MAERIGPNRRKKTAQRRRKRVSLFCKAAAIAVAATLALGACAVMHRACGPWFTELAGKIACARNPAINHLVVKGSLQVLPDELLRKAGITLPLSLDTLKKGYLSRVKAVHPWIEQVRITGRRGNTATIEVRERRPIALLSGGTVRLVDEQGVCLALERGLAYEVPLVSGLRDSADGLISRDLARLTRFLSESARVDPAFAGSVTQLHFGNDGSVTLVFSGIPTVVVMRDDAVAEGFSRLQQVWAMAAQGPYPQRIDISYSTLAFVTPHGTTRIAGNVEAKIAGKKG